MGDGGCAQIALSRQKNSVEKEKKKRMCFKRLERVLFIFFSGDAETKQACHDAGVFSGFLQEAGFSDFFNNYFYYI